MADTSQGRRLTEAHRVAQVELSGEAIVAAAALWDLLDPADVDGTRADWLALEVAALAVFDRQAADLAAEYLIQYRAAEGFPGGPVVDLDAFDAARVTTSLDGYGPGAILHRVKAFEIPTAEAKLRSLTEFEGAVQRHVLDGGRRVIDRSTLANPRSVGWRRVTDGDPCAWCALLASRGPKYRSASSAGQGRRWHDWCGCTVEEVFGTWTPTADETKYDAAYSEARGNVKGKKTTTAILAEMRVLGYR